jgi:hypothetical protein
MNTIEITSRREFAAVIRAHRRARCLRSYGRLASFGRSLLSVGGVRYIYPCWTVCSPMNVHPKSV